MQAKKGFKFRESVGYMKNRENTERRILAAVDRIVAEKGFEGIGVNAVAQEAGVAKMLIYRYFGGREGLVTHYILQGDFWSNVAVDFDNQLTLRENLKLLFRKQIEQLQENVSMRRLLRWELVTNDTVPDLLFERREANGRTIIDALCTLTHASRTEIAALSAILSASMSYLALLSERHSQYNDLDLRTAEGWEAIEKGVDLVIDMWLEHVKRSNTN